MANELKLNRVAETFADSVNASVSKMGNPISTGEARRLTINLVTKANSALEMQSMDWNKVDGNKFAVDALRIVTLGLDAANNEAYAIPYKNNKTGLVELQCSPSAWGLKKLVMQYSLGKQIEDVKAFVIREGDTFTVRHTPTDDVWTWEEDVFGSGKVKGYVTILINEDGTSNVMTHSKADIDKRRAASKASNSPAWTKWYDEMAIAKAVRRHCSKIAIKLPDDKASALDALDNPDQMDATERRVKDVTEREANQVPLSIEAEAMQEPEPETIADEPTQAEIDAHDAMGYITGEEDEVDW